MRRTGARACMRLGRRFRIKRAGVQSQLTITPILQWIDASTSVGDAPTGWQQRTRAMRLTACVSGVFSN